MDLKNVEEQLKLSEIKYRRLFEAAQDGIILIDPTTERIIDANPYLLNMIGYSLREVVGKALWEIGFFRDKQATEHVIRELQARKTVRYDDLPLEAKDGEEKEVEFISNIYSVGPIDMIQCNIRDITDRKLAERRAAVYLNGVEKLNKLVTGMHPKMADVKSEIESLKQLMKKYAA
jgi:PAS domain S-box-containing protein